MTFRTRHSAWLALLALATPLAAQSPQESAAAKAEVFSVVRRLFDGMRAKDTTAMRATLDTGATLQSVGPAGLRKTAITNWLRGVASAPDSVTLDERIANERVYVDGGLAMVWVDYWFFRNERFSHCGVDAFLLARGAGGWKIFALADTRRTEGCASPPAR
ncbi:MAG TPA: nuclear transport factor 2 family protein [Gemmatimonadaceae bacterium]|nr:nuclear transport factor 2 family protein [Gemmatimonadaceae bacterium]